MLVQCLRSLLWFIWILSIVGLGGALYERYILTSYSVGSNSSLIIVTLGNIFFILWGLLFWRKLQVFKWKQSIGDLLKNKLDSYIAKSEYLKTFYLGAAIIARLVFIIWAAYVMFVICYAMFGILVFGIAFLL